MRLKKLIAHNFRLLENFEIEFSPDITVVIGPNYAGKSSVIDAILFFRDAALGGFQNSFGARGGFEKVASWHDPTRAIGLETILRDAAHELSYKVEFDAQGLRLEELAQDGSLNYEARIDDQNPNQITHYTGSNRDASTGRGLSVLLPFNQAAGISIRGYFSSIVNVDPFRSVNFQGSVGTKEMIHATGVDLPQVLHYHYNNDREKFDSFEAMAQRVLPELDIIETPLVPGSGNVTVRIRFHASPVKFELASLSSGIKDVLVLLAAAHFSPPGSLVLIEEPENHLHPAAQKALCTVFAELAATEQKQFILTTHSEYILSQFAPEQCVFIERFGSGAKATPLPKVDAFSAWQRLGIDRSKLLEVLGRTRQVVVITEARDDAKLIEVLGRESSLTDKLLPARAEGGGSEEIIKYSAQLRDDLKRFRIPSAVFVLLDNDGERDQKLKCLEENGFDADTSHVWYEKEIESYLLLPGALAAISGKSKAEVEAVIARANGAGKAPLQWVLAELGIADTPLDVIVTNACRNDSDKLSPEFAEVVEKLRRLC